MRNDFEDVEPDGLAERSALSDDDDVSVFGGKAGGNVDRNIGVSFFESVVFFDVVQIVSSHDHCSVHLRWHHHPFQYLYFILLHSYIIIIITYYL